MSNLTVIESLDACDSPVLNVEDQLVILDELAATPVKPTGKLRSAWQRGMTTAEYAVGILAAVAFALVLLKIITGQEFFTAMMKFVVGLIGKVAGMIP